jgi:Ca2+-transporting ATPase
MPPDTTQQTPSGLSDHEAAQRLRRDGPNELPQDNRRTVWRIMLEVAREPMFQLLCAAGVIYLVLGDVGEALMLLGFVAITITISIVQEQRTENVLEALRDLTSPRALVIRDGERRIRREVACGDLVSKATGAGRCASPDGVRVVVPTSRRHRESVWYARRPQLLPCSSSSTSGGPGGDDPPSCLIAGRSRPWPGGSHRHRRTSEIGRIGRARRRRAERTPLTRDAGQDPVGGPRRSAPWSWCCTDCCAATGWAASWAGSRWRWRCCPRNSC